MLVKRLWCGALCLVACSFESAETAPQDSTPAEETSGEDGDSTAEPPTGNPVSSGTTGGTAPPSTTATTGGQTSLTDGETTDPTTDPSGDETGDVEVEPGCPETLPKSWVLCEDFEDVNDLATDFAWLDGSGLAIGSPGYQSDEALEITHSAFDSWVGELVIRFGEGPDSNNVASPETRFEEVWVRMRFRADAGWPIGGPGDLLSIDGVDDGAAWAALFKARISAGQSETAIRNSAFTCLFGSDHPCTGPNDWGFLSYLGGELGKVPVFEESVVSDWHCAVVHARLNTLGESDGVLEVVVDGEPDASATGLDFRGSRPNVGFNVLSIPTFMENPLQNDHRRYIDDVVVSAKTLTCD